MARRRHGRVRSTGGQRRKLVWARTPSTGNFVVNPSEFNGLNLLTAFNTEYGANLVGATAVRIRLRVYANYLDNTAATGFQAFAGIRVADDRVISDAEPIDRVGPFKDPHADWMLWASQSITGAGDIGSLGPTADAHYDVKAMRRFDELGQGLYLFVEHNSPSAINFNASASVLLALP